MSLEPQKIILLRSRCCRNRNLHCSEK